jgi:2-dehydro-3-deoxygluconokinase
MGKVLCFGELLMRFSPDTENQWLQQAAMPVFIGGAELNAATALARWNIPVSYFTAVPDNYLSKQILQSLQQKNIDTSVVHYSGSRIGIYYLPQGLDVKNAGVIYDRAGSSFAELKTGMVNWDAVLEGVSWFHFSAICPALNATAAEVCEEVLQACVRKNIMVSVDLNYRAKLWQYGKTPAQVMPQLVKYCDLVMGNVWAAQTMLNILVRGDLSELDQKEVYLQQAEATSQQIMEQYPKCRVVANTFRFDHDGILYYTTLYQGGKLFVSEEYQTDKVTDKVGSGDCYMAGLIYGFNQKYSPQEIVDFATAAAFQKLFIKGDATDKSADEVKAFIKKHG